MHFNGMQKKTCEKSVLSLTRFTHNMSFDGTNVQPALQMCVLIHSRPG